MSSINITSGSDANFRFEFKDGSGAAIEVSAPVVVGAAQAIADRLSATLADGPNGIVNVFLEGTELLGAGDYSFRVQVTLVNGNTLASEKVTVNVR